MMNSTNELPALLGFPSAESDCNYELLIYNYQWAVYTLLRSSCKDAMKIYKAGNPELSLRAFRFILEESGKLFHSIDNVDGGLECMTALLISDIKIAISECEKSMRNHHASD
ncbi:hypothetical protein AB0R91_02210 [Salmonella enterica subsp. enterica]|uniref:hypothetical protein n=1 Tax=Salmonella enterica TaxID=28901 RepID=UPI00344B4AD1